MNDLFVMLGIQQWKPVLTGLVMPPLPLLVLTLVGARLMFRHRLLAWGLILLGVGGTWALSTTAVGVGMMRLMLDPPRALSQAEIADLRKPPAGTPKTTIVVLGGGRELLAPEFGMSNLAQFSMERLRYGVWLGRETGLPMGFSGGMGRGAKDGPSEAEIAQRIAEREFGRRLQWIETTSRDTHENAIHSMRLLQEMGYGRIVLVTHGFHMQRAVANFERAAARAGVPLQIVPAPMGMSTFIGPPDTGWLPGSEGLRYTRITLHEWLGRLMGA